MGIFIFINTHPIRPHDFWWHITIGREILSTHQIPAIDVYSYTANGQPYPSYQMFWLMEIILYRIHSVGGLELVIFIHSLMITSAYLIIFWLSKHTSHSWRIAAFAVLFAAALGLNDWNVRPQGITFLLGSLFLLAIYRFRDKRNWKWLLIFPSGMLIWVNSHGTFFIGLILMGIWLGQEVWDVVITRRGEKSRISWDLLLAPGISYILTILICFLNPRGIGIIDYIKTLTGNSTVQNLVVEWAPPAFNSLMGSIFLTGFILSAVILAMSPKRPNFLQIASFIMFGLLGLKTLRGSVWFGLIMAPILAEHLSLITQMIRKPGKTESNSKGSNLINSVFLIIVVSVGFLSLPWFKSALPLPQAKAGLVSTETPIQATQALLDMDPEGHLFNAISFGSYLIWAASPQYQVFVDSRIELFPTKVWMDYLTISNAGDDWEELLQGYGVNALMISPVEQMALMQAVSESDAWSLLYQDETSAIFERK
jgi:hypothetical protein